VPLSYKDVAEIIKIIDASKLDEFVIEIDGAKMHVRRGASGGSVGALPAIPASSVQAPSSSPSPKVAAAPNKAAASATTQQIAGHAVRSPMVGTFYRAPSPKDPPFVEAGSIVKRGDPLCLIEVMKLFTTISADQDGRIAHILPANGDLVEFDQVLFVIEAG